MLYLILPPIIAVISLAALIVFVSRRLSKLSPEEIKRQQRIADQEKKTIARIVDINKVNHWTLAVLERMTQWFKITFLKFHNKSDSLFRLIREKKKEVKEEILIREEVERIDSGVISESTDGEVQLEKREEIVIEKVEVVSSEKPVRKFDFFEIKRVLRREGKQPEEIKAEVVVDMEISEDAEPMLSKEIVRPDSMMEAQEKNELEEVLIERIATDPRDVEAYERLGDYYMEKKSNHDAYECFRQVIKLSPANRRTRLKMKRLERIMKK